VFWMTLAMFVSLVVVALYPPIAFWLPHTLGY
jgi:hypothetical protein